MRIMALVFVLLVAGCDGFKAYGNGMDARPSDVTCDGCVVGDSAEIANPSDSGSDAGPDVVPDVAEASDSADTMGSEDVQDAADAADVSPDVPACASGQTMCTSGCVDPTTDQNNCGACGNACGDHLTCMGGACGNPCPYGQESCGGTCTNERFSAEACGACALTACGSGQTCGMNVYNIAVCCDVHAGDPSVPGDGGFLVCRPGTCPAGYRCGLVAGCGSGGICQYYCCPPT